MSKYSKQIFIVIGCIALIFAANWYLNRYRDELTPRSLWVEKKIDPNPFNENRQVLIRVDEVKEGWVSYFPERGGMYRQLPIRAFLWLHKPIFSELNHPQNISSLISETDTNYGYYLAIDVYTGETITNIARIFNIKEWNKHRSLK